MPARRSAIIAVAPTRAGVAQLVEYELPKLGVEGSSPFARSMNLNGCDRWRLLNGYLS